MNSEGTNPHTQYEPAQTKGWCLGLTAAFLMFTLLIIFIFVGQMLAYFNRTAPGQSTRVAVRRHRVCNRRPNKIGGVAR